MRSSQYLLGCFLGLFIVANVFGLLTPKTSWATLQCGDTIGPVASAFLTHDLNCSGHDPALTVVGPATLMMLGHTLDCQDAEATGIQVNGEAAIVLKGTVTGCDVGIRVGGEGSHLIKEITASRNDRGIGLVNQSHGNILKYNETRDSSTAGFTTLGMSLSDGNEFSWNSSKNDSGNGFEVRGSSNTFKYNKAKNYTNRGYRVMGTDNMMTQNTALGGGVGSIGFDISDGDGNTVMQNLAKNNTGQGFFMDDGKDFQVLGNTAKNNDDGIFMENGAINSTILGNIALGNTDVDLIDGNSNCDNNQWIANRFRTRNENCIH